MELIKMRTVDEVRGLREDYLSNLSQPQELYTEFMLRDSKPFVVKERGREIGYFLLNPENMLQEFHVTNDHINRSEKAFRKVLKDLGVKRALCQSFDHLYLSMCMMNMNRRKMIGYHFRERIKPEKPVPDKDLNMRRATLDDVDLITRYSDGLFEEEEVKDIPYWIELGSCIIFDDRGGNFVGYGMFNRTVADRNWYDIGMYVRPEMRRKGYGTYIIDRMASHVEELGGIPTAGCAYDNKASKRTLERAGFVSKHVMVEFGF